MNHLTINFFEHAQLVHVNSCYRCKQQHLRQTFNNFVVQFMHKTCVTTTKYMTQKFFMLFVVK